MFPVLHRTAFLLNKLSRPFGESILKIRREKEALLAQKLKKDLSATYVSVTDTTIGNSSCSNVRLLRRADVQHPGGIAPVFGDQQS